MSGRFVWHELMTTDKKGAIAFYTEVIGFKTQDFEGTTGPEPYTMWATSEGPMGGVMTLPDEAKKMGVPPHWMGHVGVDDVDATVQKAKAKGGNVLVPPTDIPTIGRFSVIADPTGASLSVFASATPMEAHDTSKPGEISWNELICTDKDAAAAFYAELFGWKQISEMDMGPAGKYLLFGQGDKPYGGMMNKTPEMPMPSTWIYYFNVDDIEAAMQRATSKGAKKIYGPQDIPGGTRVAQMIDPQGAVFALHAPK